MRSIIDKFSIDNELVSIIAKSEFKEISDGLFSLDIKFHKENKSLDFEKTRQLLLR